MLPLEVLENTEKQERKKEKNHPYPYHLWESHC